MNMRAYTVLILFIYAIVIVHGSERLRKFNLAPGDQLVMEGWNSGGGSGSSSSSSSSSDGGSDDDDTGGCFAGSESVLTSEGVRKPINSVTIGEHVQVLNEQGEMTFSEVVYIPHGKNTMTATFIELFTETGKSLQITPTHIIPIYKNCIDQNKGEYEMIYAANVNIGYCLLTTNGTEKLVSVENSRGYGGMYTLVTADSHGLLVVNEVVASSFAFTHDVTNHFYHIHRFLYRYFARNSIITTSNLLVMGMFEIISNSVLSSFRG